MSTCHLQLTLTNTERSKLKIVQFSSEVQQLLLSIVPFQMILYIKMHCTSDKKKLTSFLYHLKVCSFCNESTLCVLIIAV